MTQFSSDYASHSTYVPDQTEDTPAQSPVRVNDTISRITTMDSVSQSVQEQKTYSYDSRDANPSASND